ncbi:hypothetical protein BH09BAC3_BH09BAC3_19510 [soil metagenome]
MPDSLVGLACSEVVIDMNAEEVTGDVDCGMLKLGDG